MVIKLKTFRSDGHLSAEAAALYVDALKLGRVDRLPGDLRMHVEECFECKTEVTGLFSLVADSDYSQGGPHPTLETPKSFRGIAPLALFKVAASVAAVVGLSALGYWWLHHASDSGVESPTPVAQHPVISDTVQIQQEEKVVAGHQPLAAVFAESPEMEDLMKSGVRSEELEVSSPIDGIAVMPGFRFEWTTAVKPPFQLLIVDNRDRIVHSVRLRESGYTMKEQLPRGLYYWRLVGEGELLHVGKFRVR